MQVGRVVQVSVLGEYTSTDARLDDPSSPPTTYRRPFSATTPKEQKYFSYYTTFIRKNLTCHIDIYESKCLYFFFRNKRGLHINL